VAAVSTSLSQAAMSLQFGQNQRKSDDSRAKHRNLHPHHSPNQQLSLLSKKINDNKHIL
jgi:hypothetical protein